MTTLHPRRFYVRAPGMEPLHILHGPRIEGQTTDCGRPITTAWTWLKDRRQHRAVCKKCQEQTDKTP